MKIRRQNRIKKMKQQTKNRLVVADAGWAKSIPDWIKEEIKQERIMYGMMDIMKKTETVGDAEVAAYLYTANLHGPISHELGQIYIYLTGTLMKKVKGLKDDDLSDFLQEKLKNGLTDYEKSELECLKRDLYRKRGGKINSPILNILRELGKGVKE